MTIDKDKLRKRPSGDIDPGPVYQLRGHVDRRSRMDRVADGALWLVAMAIGVASFVFIVGTMAAWLAGVR